VKFRSSLILFLVLVAVAVCGGCKTEEPKPRMAVINTKEVITKCNAGLKAAQEVREKFSQRQEDLKKLEESIAALRADPTIADAASPKRAELEQLANKYIADSQALRKDMGEEETARYKPIVDKVNKILSQYAKEHGLVSIQDKNGFAYIDASIDITGAIIKKLDDAG